MTRKPKPEVDDLLPAMRRAIMRVLNDKNADLADLMKAIEAGGKLLAIEHKIGERKGVNARGSFFAAANSAED